MQVIDFDDIFLFAIKNDLCIKVVRMGGVEVRTREDNSCYFEPVIKIHYSVSTEEETRTFLEIFKYDDDGICDFSKARYNELESDRYYFHKRSGSF